MAWQEINLVQKALARSVRHYITKPDDPTLASFSDIQLVHCHNTNQLTLTEDGVNAALRVVNLDDISREGLTLKLDAFGVSFFSKDTANRACDYVVLSEHNGKKYALFIELKTSINCVPDSKGRLVLANREDLKKAWQLNGGSNLFDYVSLILKNHYTCSELDNYEKRFFLFYSQVRSPTTGPIQPTANPTLGAEINMLRHKNIAAIKVSNNQCVRISTLCS